MTIEEQIARSKALSQHMLQVALTLGLWFVAEYFITVLSTHNILLAALRTPLMLVMPVALCFILHRIRKQYFEDEEFGRFRCWYYGVQVMFYAGLIEAFAIAIYNQWISPDNLTEMHNAMIAQYEDISKMYAENPDVKQIMPGLSQTFEDMVNVLKETEVETPFSAAITMLSNDIFYGCIWSIPFCFILHRKKKEK